MIASISSRLIIVIDESKYVSVLGGYPLPVEIVPFGAELTSKQVSTLGCIPKMRTENNAPFITDNGNYILDCDFNKISNPNDLASKLNRIPGVVENGLFVNMANTVVVGRRTGAVDYFS